MVQRKPSDKLGIQADSGNHVKSEKQSTVLKSSVSQIPEVKNKGGPELKKLMKKSRSIKRSEFDCLKSNSMKRRAKARPDKPLVPSSALLMAAVTPKKLPVSIVTPQKVPQLRVPETPPNYMKSTSSSSARKERSQVSPHGPKTSSDSKSPARKDSNIPKLSLVSGHKPGKTLTKTPSLRPVRTLTKSSSNKPGRTSMKKKSGAGWYTHDQNVRRDTCSSTLKDSKFPVYVTLHPGGTESEGTSVMKVCPYTYCSLNGHHHAQLPPLKVFLSARRRLLRTQKNMRLKNLSTVSRKASGKPKEDIDTGQIVLNEDPAIPEEDFDGPAISPLIREEEVDFFLDIYTQPWEDASDSDRNKTDGVNNEVKKDFSDDPWALKSISYSVKDGAEVYEKIDSGTYAESLPDGSSHSAICYEDNIDHDIDLLLEEMNTSLFFHEQIQMEEVEDKALPLFYTQAETDIGYCGSENISAEIETDDSMSESASMDWEEGEVVDLFLTDEAEVSNVTSDEHDPTVTLQGFAETVHDELTYKPYDIVSNGYEEFPANEEMQVVRKENNKYLEEEFDAADDGLEIEFSSRIYNEKSDNSCSSGLQNPIPSDEVFLAISEEKDEEPDINELINVVISSDAAESEEPIDTAVDDDISTCRTQVEHEAQLGEQEDNSSESGIQENASPQNPDASAEVCLLKKEPEDEAVATINGFNKNNILPDVNVHSEGDEAGHNESQLEGKEPNYRSRFSDQQSYSEGSNLKSVENCSNEDVEMEEGDGTGADKTTIINAVCSSNQHIPISGSNSFKPNRCKKPIENCEEPRDFNPRGPRFLPLEPEEDPEKVDLRHQMIDERKSSEEWMLDFALRQAVSKLAPARKRKVALLVQAFETIIPSPRYEIHLPHTPTGFTQTRFMQACS